MPVDPFSRNPIREINGIPVFSEATAYIENYERIASDHLDTEARTGHNPFIAEDLWRDSEASTVALIRKYAAPGQRILDVGVGLGRLLSQFPDLDRYGIDISAAYLERARARGINVALGLVEELPYLPATFDVVLATDVLEHVLDLNTAVRQMLTVLRPGGYLIVRSPNAEDLSGYLAADYPYRWVHLRTFDEASIRLLFDRVFDCKVVETRLAGYLAQRPYLRVPVPLISRLVVRPLLSVAPGMGGRVVRRLYRPIEINAVVEKPSAPAPRFDGADATSR